MLSADDALRVADLIRTADGGCHTCIASLCERANRMFAPHWVFALDAQAEYTRAAGDEHIDGRNPKYPVVTVTHVHIQN